MEDERTPLIQVVRVAPQRQRYSHSTIRRFCTIALACTLVVVIILFLLPLGWLSGGSPYPGHNHTRPYPPHREQPSRDSLSYSDLQQILLDTPSEDKAKEWSSYYASGPHLAGKNLSQAVWTKERWQEFGIKDTNVVPYEVYINYPKGHRLALLERTDDREISAAVEVEGKIRASDYKIKYECSLEEDVLDTDPTTGLKDRIPTFHGYSASGNVTARYVYVNFGTYQDFEDLIKANVSLDGKIALAKYGKIFRGLKVKRAQELGMVGALMYSDPQEDGKMTEENGHKPYPEGPARNPSSVQRGSVQYLSILPGDPTTPGYPSLPGAPRQDPSFSTPKIPSLPISYQDALPLLKALNGMGPKASDFNSDWEGGGLGNKGVEYNIGPSPPELVLNLVNEMEHVTTPLWNVIGIINGTIPDEVVVIGNHRDAWIAGGAGDPNSGSAALNEVVRSFGTALEKGWRPLRTIVIASWDGEEYGLIGSTEWVEQYIPWLSKDAIAYLNLDVSTAGPYFHAAASPLLHGLIHNVTSVVLSPNHTTAGQSIHDTWDGQIYPIGSGSDFTAFQDFAGIPSMDFGFHPGPDSPVYHYHSNYDSLTWMDTYGDPGWHYHIASARILALLAARLVETPIIALNTTDYAAQLVVYLEQAIDHVRRHESPKVVESHTHLFQNLEDAIRRLLAATTAFDAEVEKLTKEMRKHVSWWKWWKKADVAVRVREVNRKLKMFERAYLHPEGLDGRSWFKHVVFAPGKWTGYSGATFPGLIEAIDEGDKEAVQRWSVIIEGRVAVATDLLNGE